MIDYGIKGKVALITGANNPQGIGAATALAFAQQYIVDLIGGVEIAEALLADNGIQGDLVQGADDLNNGGGHSQQHGTLQEILLFGRFGHK